MKERSLIIVGGLVILLTAIIFIIRFVFGGAEDDWICTSSGWVKHGNPSAPVPGEACNVNY